MYSFTLHEFSTLFWYLVLGVNHWFCSCLLTYFYGHRLQRISSREINRARFLRYVPETVKNHHESSAEAGNKPMNTGRRSQWGSEVDWNELLQVVCSEVQRWYSKDDLGTGAPAYGTIQYTLPTPYDRDNYHFSLARKPDFFGQENQLLTVTHRHCILEPPATIETTTNGSADRKGKHTQHNIQHTIQLIQNTAKHRKHHSQAPQTRGATWRGNSKICAMSTVGRIERALGDQ